MLYRLAEIEEILANEPGLYLRYSDGFAADLEVGSVDTESGLRLPGLAARPLDPEPWWTRPAREWIARQVAVSGACGTEACGTEDGRFGWLLRGVVAGRGADGEPLIADVEVVGRLADCLIAEAAHLYGERFASGLSAREAELVAVAHA